MSDLLDDEERQALSEICASDEDKENIVPSLKECLEQFFSEADVEELKELVLKASQNKALKKAFRKI